MALPMVVLSRLTSPFKKVPSTLQPLMSMPRFASEMFARLSVSSPVAGSMPVWMSARISIGFCDASLKCDDAMSIVHEPLVPMHKS